jgi:diguanylate cyclase (GGDEF)-like protein
MSALPGGTTVSVEVASQVAEGEPPSRFRISGLSAILSWSYHRELLRCRLCRWVALAMFASIMAVETIILVPSYQREETRLVDQAVREGLAVMRAMLATSAPPDAARVLTSGAGTAAFGPLKGGALWHADGRSIARFGEPATSGLAPGTTAAGVPASASHFAVAADRIETLWTPSELGAPAYVLARLDARHVGEALRGFVLRIGTLVLLIAAVTTFGTMLVLGHLVLAPLLRLRRAALEAASDPDHPARHQVAQPSNDEIGELADAFNTMLGRIDESQRIHRQAEAAERRRLTTQDALTGLSNRSIFLEELTWAFAEEQNFALFLLDLDRFKELNEMLGHGAGDAVLKRTADRLSQAGPGALLARLGSDEFALVSTRYVEPESATAFATGLLRRLGAPHALDQQEIGVGVSCGIAFGPRDAESPEALLRCAEQALYRAKRDGRGRVRFFDAALDQRARRRRLLEHGLRTAVERDQLRLLYQPKFTFAGTRLVGGEALLRWQISEAEEVSPLEFIPIAEETGLIMPIGAWVLSEACRQVASWRAAGLEDFRIAVNLSAVQFRDPGLVPSIDRALTQSGLPAAWLELEVTESMVMDDVESARGILGAIAARGVHISIDDFGTWHSSLAYLRRLPVDGLKIDRSFVNEIGQSRDAETIARAIVGLGHALGLEVVAEGVETPSQLEFLAGTGCDLAQGFHLGRPITPDAFQRLWTEASAASAAE